MPKFLFPSIIAVVATLSTISLHAAPEPRVFLERDWYVVEVIMFERSDELPSSEHLLHGAQLRTFSQDLRSLAFGEQEVSQSLEEEPDLTIGTPELNLSSESNDQQDESFVRDRSIDSVDLSLGCWLHLKPYARAIAEIDTDSNVLSSQLDSSSDRPVDTRFEEVDGVSVLTRDPILPDWMPDDWETADVIFERLGRSLGLCDEDLQALLETEYATRQTETEDKEEELVTPTEVRETFADFEKELYATVGTRRTNSELNLTRTANRLRNEGYRVIDHAAWHQDAPAQGSEKSTLVQFGRSDKNRLYEIEGTLDLSLARFLNLDIELWRTVQVAPEEFVDRTPRPRIFYYLLRESRRLALGEIHYFDHPKFGMLVQIRRIAIPRDLVDLVQQLDG